MPQFTEEIEALKHRVKYVTISAQERKILIEGIEKLMILDGWEPGSLAKRVDALEEAFLQVLDLLPSEQRKKIGFPLPE